MSGTRTEPRSYPSDDRDIDEQPMEMQLFQGENGDWYLSVLPIGDRFTRHCVRITTHGTRRHDMPAAVAALYRAMGKTE